MTLLLTSYKENRGSETPPSNFIEGDRVPTDSGMMICHEETFLYAEKLNRNNEGRQIFSPPENTRSNSADRIKRIRENISKQENVESEIFKQSAILFIKCVLSSVYGEPVTIDTYNMDRLRNNDYKGRNFFLENMQKALYEDDPILMARNEIICIRRGKTLIGLLSSAGPIPVVEKNFYLPVLSINEENDLRTILDNLSAQDKNILRFWLTENKDEDTVSQCRLYNKIKSIIKSDDLSPEILKGIGLALEIDKNVQGIPGFLLFKSHSHPKLEEHIILTPIFDEKTKFGYDMDASMVIEVKREKYVCLPPLTEEAVKSSQTDDFIIKSITCKLSPDDIKNNKIVSLAIQCCMEMKGLVIWECNTYIGENIQFIMNFPPLSLYSPAPKFGWIARRDDSAPSFNHPSPICGDAETYVRKNIIFVDHNSLQDEFIPLKFKDTGSGYSIYCGGIPKWLGVKGARDKNEGIWLGAIPLCSLNAQPCSIYKELPTGEIDVAADIGSSRSVVVFKKGDERDVILIEENKELGIPLISSSDETADTVFNSIFFQPRRQHKEVSGKRPVGILIPSNFNSINTDNLLLYESGKIILLDPKSISEAIQGKASIKSNIKAEEDQQGMNLLIQGILTMIIDRSLHLGCSKINIYLSFLKERFHLLNDAWTYAISKISGLISYDDIKINHKMYLPESLAIANKLTQDKNFTPIGGAVIVDIGDLSTDIALYYQEFAGDEKLKLVHHTSILFAGREIILQRIWDYLNFSGKKVESIFNCSETGDNEAVKRLQDKLDNQRNKIIKEQKDGKSGEIDDDIRRDLLCLITKLKKLDSTHRELQNLLDICYLTEAIILKHIVKKLPHDSKEYADVDIYLFGGGSSLVKTDGYNWKEVINYGSHIKPMSEKEYELELAYGLLIKLTSDLENASQIALQEAKNFRGQEQANSAEINESIKGEKLTQGYLQFIKDAQIFNPGWSFMKKNNILVEKIDEVLDLTKTELWGNLRARALEFTKRGSITDKDIIMTLCAYKIAYSSALVFYSKEVKR